MIPSRLITRVSVQADPSLSKQGIYFFSVLALLVGYYFCQSAWIFFAKRHHYAESVEGVFVTLVTLLTLNASITTKVVCFSRLLKCLRSLYDKQCGPRSDCSYIGAVCFGSTLFASILNSSVMLCNYLQQTTSADDIFRCMFFLGALRVKIKSCQDRLFLSFYVYSVDQNLIIIRGE